MASTSLKKALQKQKKALQKQLAQELAVLTGDCFVSPQVDRLTVKVQRGHIWIDVKHRLNAGEYEDLFERWHDDKGAFKASRVRRSKILTYVIAWSLKQPVSDDAIKALEMSVFRALAEAIEEHETASEAEATVKKTDPDGESDSSPTLPSPNL